jgi:YHS domain-containing protein
MHATRLAVLAVALVSADGPAAPDPRQALQPFNALIGAWRGTGIPEGTAEEKRAGFWSEALAWEWQFPKSGPQLILAFDKGKYFARATLRPLAQTQRYQLRLTDHQNVETTFEGTLRERTLTVDRDDPSRKETQRVVLTLLHDNRFLYRYEVRPAGLTVFKRLYQVGATKEGVPFAGPGDNQPECVVSGGRGTIRVTHKGKEYFVCCSGCRDAFQAEPEKYIAEYEARKRKP